MLFLIISQVGVKEVSEINEVLFVYKAASVAIVLHLKIMAYVSLVHFAKQA